MSQFEATLRKMEGRLDEINAMISDDIDTFAEADIMNDLRCISKQVRAMLANVTKNR